MQRHTRCSFALNSVGFFHNNRVPFRAGTSQYDKLVVAACSIIRDICVYSLSFVFLAFEKYTNAGE